MCYRGSQDKKEQSYWELSYHGSARSEIRELYDRELGAGVAHAQAIDSLVLLKKAAKSKAIVAKGEGFIF
jgi:hypothetical protein